MNTTECLCRRRYYEQAKDFFHFELWYHLMDSQANLWRNRFSLPGFIKPFQGHGVVSVFRYWDFRWIYFPHTLPIKRKTLKVLLNLEATPMHLNHVKRRFCKRDCFQAPSSFLPIACSWTCRWKSTQLYYNITWRWWLFSLTIKYYTNSVEIQILQWNIVYFYGLQNRRLDDCNTTLGSMPFH